MRVVVVVCAALLTLALAAFGVVAAQKSPESGSLVAFAEHILSPAQAKSTPTAPRADNQIARTHIAPAQIARNEITDAPIIKVSEATVALQPA
ncbi:MAG: hypothetical protein WA652_19885, partial [Xanthobacteraceae bacterium]